MATRLDLHEELCEILGSRYVYFQPTTNVRMQYPCIKYSISDIDNTFANNGVYKQDRAYELIVIDYEPDSVIVDNLSKLPGIRFNRPYVSDNLYHTVFTLYY